MAPDSGSQEWISKKVALLVKEFRRTDTQLTDFLALQSSLQNLVRELHDLTEKTGLKTEWQEALSRELNSLEFFEQFIQLKAKIANLKQNVLELEEPLVQATVFLENNRTYRYYQFSEASKTISFLAQFAELYTVPAFVFKPDLIGLVSLVPLEKELQLQKNKNGTFLVPTEKLEPLFKFLTADRMAKQFRLDTPEAKIHFQSTLSLKTEATNSVIKRLDRLAISLEGKVLEK